MDATAATLVKAREAAPAALELDAASLLAS